MIEKGIVVSFANDTVTVSDPVVHVPFGETAEFTWQPEAGADWVLNRIIFMRPVGAGTPITIPRPGPGGSLRTTDVNQNPSTGPDKYKYLVLIEKDGRIFPSEDPEIVNDPEGGVMDDDGEGGG